MDSEKAYYLYTEGKFPEAVLIYQECAKKGDINCQRRLGFMYYQGKGVVRDLSNANYWFLQAYEHGDEQASVGLFRVLVERGEYVKALLYMRAMARKSYPPALYWLGRMYSNGYGVHKSSKRAFVYFTLAAQHGHFVAKRDRAKMLLGGHCGFLSRGIGVYELCHLTIVITKALHEDINDERQYY